MPWEGPGTGTWSQHSRVCPVKFRRILTVSEYQAEIGCRGILLTFLTEAKLSAVLDVQLSGLA